MNVLPSNQTLILASERRTGSPKTLEQALSAASSAATLKRVTIVAAHPDTTLLYVQADYTPASGGDAGGYSYARSQTPDDSYAADVTGSGGGALVATSSRDSVVTGTAVTGTVRRDTYGNARSSNGAVEQYASTQRILAENPAASHVNVHA